MFSLLWLNRPSFVEGIARILDFGNTLNENDLSSDLDELSMRTDWEYVGDDLRSVIKEYEGDSSNAV